MRGYRGWGQTNGTHQLYSEKWVPLAKSALYFFSFRTSSSSINPCSASHISSTLTHSLTHHHSFFLCFYLSHSKIHHDSTKCVSLRRQFRLQHGHHGGRRLHPKTPRPSLRRLYFHLHQKSVEQTRNQCC